MKIFVTILLLFAASFYKTAFGFNPEYFSHDHERARLDIDAVWARETSPRARAGAVYLRIKNTGHYADKLLAASTDRAMMAEIHESSIENGVAQMRPAVALVIAPESELIFEPGGLHIMLMGLKERLAKGETFPLTLIFEKAGAKEVTVTITPVTGPEH